MVIIIILHNCGSTEKVKVLNREDFELSQNSDLRLFNHGFENYYISHRIIPYIIIISFLYETAKLPSKTMNRTYCIRVLI